MGMEKALTALACGLAGGNMIYESSGMMASLLGASFEAFVMDDEMLSLVYRMIRGIEVNNQSLEFDSIQSVVSDTGHFLGQPETMLSMERDYFYPSIADREEPTVWQEQGALDHLSRAKTKAKELLNHHPNYLSDEIEASIRRYYPILL
jgi:trimethylamine--corrinoid protein Co-methyltransferase